AANFQITIRIFGIDDGERDARIAPYIFIFLPSPGGVEDDVVAVEIAPDGSDLRAAIGHEGGEAGEGALLEKILVLLGDGLRHEFLQEIEPLGNYRTRTRLRGSYVAFSRRRVCLQCQVPPKVPDLLPGFAASWIPAKLVSE